VTSGDRTPRTRTNPRNRCLPDRVLGVAGQADAFRRWSMKVIAAAGALVVVAGLVAAIRGDAFGGSKSRQAYLCADNHSTEMVPGSLWILWLIVVGLFAVSTLLRSRLVRRDSLTEVLWAGGLICSVLLFPGWLIISTDLNCGL